MTNTFYIGIVGSLQILSLDWKNKSQRIPNKAKLISQQTDKISQQPENWENRNDFDLEQSKNG